jgi:hypothetical protein
MRRTTTTIVTAAALATIAVPALALDCARVQELAKGGARASDIARTLGITTPDVQACLAGEIEEKPVANAAGKLPLAPQVPQGDAPIRRAPDGQEQ